MSGNIELFPLGNADSARITITDEYAVLNGVHLQFSNGYIYKRNTSSFLTKDILSVERQKSRNKRFLVTGLVLFGILSLLFGIFGIRTFAALDFMYFVLFVGSAVCIALYAVKPAKILRIKAMGGDFAVAVKHYAADNVERFFTAYYNKSTTKKSVNNGIYDIFISYRRDGGETMAILLHDRLTLKGYRVFLDVESLNSGKFNEKLFSVIEKCKDFIVVLSENSLDRCVNEGDWVRNEIAYAFKQQKNIIPFILRGFKWSENLPDDISDLPMQNGINAISNEYFDAAIERLVQKFLVSKIK